MLPYGNKYTPRSTPYHVSELILQLLRITFSAEAVPDFPFKYTESFDTTQLLIDTTFNPCTGLEGLKPQIIVSHGDSNSQAVSTGDMASKNMSNCTTTKTSLVTSSCMARVISSSKTDVCIISNEVFNFFMTCRTMLPGRLTSIQSIQNVSMTQAAQAQMDDIAYQCFVSIVYQMQYKWADIVPGAVLEGYVLYIDDEKKMDK